MKNHSAIYLKKITYLFLTLLLILSVAACSKEPEEDNSVGDIYGMKTIEIPNDLNSVDVMLTHNAALILDGVSIININYDGDVQEITLLSESQSETEQFTCFDMDQDGNYIALSVQLSEVGDVIEGLTVYWLDSSGKLLNSMVITGTFGEKETNFYPLNFIAEDGYYYIQSFGGMYIYDESGSLVFEFIDERGDSYFDSLFRLKDGRIASNSFGSEGGDSILFVRIYDPAAKDFEEYKIKVIGNSSDCNITCGVESDILLSDSNGLHEYELETGSRKLLMNFLDHGVNVKDIMELLLTSAGDIVCVFRGDTWMAEEIAIFRPQSQLASTPQESTEDTSQEVGEDTSQDSGEDISQDSEEDTSQDSEEDTPSNEFEVPKEKEVITLAILEMDLGTSWIQNYISAFNSRNKDYTIQLKTYLDGDNYDDALRVFNMEVMSGNAPDIIAMDYRMRVQSYINKGIFADLYDFMDHDPSFNKDDFLPNVFETLEVDGKLHTIFPLFTIDTIIAKTSDVGKVPGWTIDEFLEFLESKPEAEYIIGDFTKKRFLRDMIVYYFTDPKTGEIKFDREAFYKILEATERFPSEFELPEDTSYTEFLRNTRRGDPLMMRTNLMGGFRITVKYNQAIYFGEDITFKGFPVPEGTGACIVPGGSFAISESSTMKDGAWEFIKFTLEEYRDNWNYNFPIRISGIEKMAEDALNQGEMEYEMETGEKVKVGSNTQEDNDKLMDLIKSTRLIYPFYSKISDIIIEELEFYLSGQKTPEQLVDIIENRVNLFISESE